MSEQQVEWYCNRILDLEREVRELKQARDNYKLMDKCSQRTIRALREARDSE